ncbi:MAG: hypothetical protein R3C10_20890 [Pirellulales bacterium]
MTEDGSAAAPDASDSPDESAEEANNATAAPDVAPDDGASAAS